jgi:hypothetical protein
MPAEDTLKVLLTLLVAHQGQLARGTRIPEYAPRHAAVGRRAEDVNQRLHGPVDAADLRAFLSSVRRRPKTDVMRRFLVDDGDDMEYTIRSPEFMNLVLAIAVDFANFKGAKRHG